jgi:hypothetical protein
MTFSDNLQKSAKILTTELVIYPAPSGNYGLAGRYGKGIPYHISPPVPRVKALKKARKLRQLYPADNRPACFMQGLDGVLREISLD